MKIHLMYFPQEIIDKYDLKNKITQAGYIYIRIKKGVYDLK